MPALSRKCLNCTGLHLLLVMMLLSRALVPVGYMPGQGGLALCPAYAAADEPAGHGMAGMHMAGMDMTGMAMPGQHGAGHQGGPAGHEGTCTFAAAGTAIAFVHSLPPVAYLPLAQPESLPPVDRFIPRGTIVPTHLPRGPPAHYA